MVFHAPNHTNNHTNNNQFNHFKQRNTKRLHKLNNQIQRGKLKILKTLINHSHNRISHRTNKEQMREKFKIVLT